MKYNDILNSDYFKNTYKKIEKIKKDFPVNHGFIHIENVVRNAKRLVLTFNLNAKQEELLLIACLLHDVGYLKGRDEHASNGAILAKKYLIQNGFNREDIKLICDAIKNHGGKKHEDFIEPISMCLVIADKIDFISSRYNSLMLEENKAKVFSNVLDTILEYNNDQIVLKIFVNKEFDKYLFENEKHCIKLNNMLINLEKRFSCDSKIEYVIIE